VLLIGLGYTALFTASSSKVRNKFIQVHHVQNLNTKRPLPDRTNRIIYSRVNFMFCHTDKLMKYIDLEIFL